MLLESLKQKDEIYDYLLVNLTYHSNKIEGSSLSLDETVNLYEKRNKIDGSLSLDARETLNHFEALDLVLEHVDEELTEELIKKLHYTLKVNTTKEKTVGVYKIHQNQVGDKETTRVEDVEKEMKRLLKWYHSLDEVRREDIIEFHYRFESIHPFLDGNGRVGRLIMLKECLKYHYVPIMILDEYKVFYYRGLKERENDPRYLIDTCLLGQDIMKEILDNFSISY